MSCEALVQQLRSGSQSKQHQAVAALSVLPLTPRTWLSAVGAIPHLVQLLHSTSTSEPRDLVILNLLQHISSPNQYLDARDMEAAPDGIIPPLVPLLLRHNDAHVWRVAALTLSALAVNEGNQHKIMAAGAITPLVQLLKSSSEDLHSPAARALAFLAENSNARSSIIAAGAIAPFLKLFSSSTVEVQWAASMAVRIFACDDADLVAAAGAIPLLVQLLKSSSAYVQWEAVKALSHLTYHADLLAEMVAAGAVPPLVGLLSWSSGSSGSTGSTGSTGSLAEKLQREAALTLGQIRTSKAKSEIIASGAIQPLVIMLDSDSEAMQSAAAFLIVHLSCGDKPGQAKIAAAGAIAPLVRLLRTASSEQLQARVTKALANLASNDAKGVAKAGAIPILVEHLAAGSMEARGLAAGALQTIAHDSDTLAEIMAAAPLLPLVRLLTSSSEVAQDHAQLALLLLSNTPSFPEQLVAAGAIPPLVQMLSIAESASVQEGAVATLKILAETGRSDISATIENAGALPLLVRLQAAASSSEAMRYNVGKLLRDLCTGKFRY